jgi:flagellar hook-length control protein FliK
MLQMAQLLNVAGLAENAKAAKAADPVVTLEGLLRDETLLTEGFGAELQGMLMHLPPVLLQRLEQLVAGGMGLPQAARTLLAEQGMMPDADAFAELLQQGGARQETPVLPQTPRMPAARGGMPTDALAALRAAAAIETANPVDNAVGAASAVHAPSAGGAIPMPPQLAGSLLQMGVPQAVGGRAWEGAIADRVMWMVQGEQQMAKLKLNPPNLGPLEIRVSVNQDQASVAFVSQHAVVREALEAAMPRLRELFDQQSLQLVQADVSDPGAQQRERAGDSAHGQGPRDPWSGDALGDEAAEVGLPQSRTGNGLIDLFA